MFFKSIKNFNKIIKYTKNELEENDKIFKNFDAEFKKREREFYKLKRKNQIKHNKINKKIDNYSK